MAHKALERISQRRVLFLSPHLDDLAFSCSSLLAMRSQLRSLHTINVFCRSTWAPNLVVKNASEITKVRLAEDAQFRSMYGVTADNLEFPDSSCRGYDDNTELTATPSIDDARPAIASALRTRLRSGGYDLVFCPLAIGNHIDHRLVLDAVVTMGDLQAAPVAFYEEIPYCAAVTLSDIDSIARARSAGSALALIVIDIRNKLKGMKAYASQTRSVDLYAAYSHARRRGGGTDFAEAVWIPE